VLKFRNRIAANRYTLYLYCRWLHPDDPWREDEAGEFGSSELGETPAPRTHRETMEQAKEAEEYSGPNDKHPENTHGIRGTCPLGLLAFFDIIWDLCPDMMHINKNLWDRCIVALLTGRRKPTLSKKNPNPGRFKCKDHRNENKTSEPPKKKRKPVNYEELRRKHNIKLSEYTREHARYTRALAKANAWALTAAQQKAFDKRIRSIANSGIIPFSLAPCKTIPGYKKPKSATWITFLRSCVPYTMSGVPLIAKTCVVGLCGTLSKILLTTCDYIPGDREATAAAKLKIQELKTELIRAMCIFERDVPESELSYFLHEILHLCDFLYRWNNVRNYWCFLVERFVGYVKGFVKNRHLVLESLVSVNR
jgi:hypothetical protein